MNSAKISVQFLRVRGDARGRVGFWGMRREGSTWETRRFVRLSRACADPIPIQRREVESDTQTSALQMDCKLTECGCNWRA